METLIEVLIPYFFDCDISWVKYHQDEFEILQIKNPILNFLLLELKILIDFSSDASHENDRFFETLAEKSLKFIANRKNGIITFNLDLVLLPVEVDPIPQE